MPTTDTDTTEVEVYIPAVNGEETVVDETMAEPVADEYGGETAVSTITYTVKAGDIDSV